MRNLFIIHSYNADIKESFGPYLKEEAEKLGIEVIFPDFPIRQEATYKKWSDIMNFYLKMGKLNEKSIIVAHSLGTYFTAKYIAEKNIPISLYISCAGVLENNSGREDIEKVVKDFIPSDKEIDKAISLMKNRYSIYSNNDHLNPQNELERYADRFNAKKIFIPNIGHLGKSSGIKKLKEAVDIIKENLD